MKAALLIITLMFTFPVMADDFQNQMEQLQENNRHRFEEVQQEMRQQDQVIRIQNEQIQIRAEQERQKALIDYGISQQLQQR